MTLFRTQIPIKQSFQKIDYQSSTLFIGSCFAENISEKFSYYKLKNLANPFGVMFNIFSIENILVRIIENNKFTESTLFKHQDLWSSLEVHSKWSDVEANQILERLNTQLENAHNFVNQASHIIISLGSSWVYRHKISDKYVANCHKIPQKDFFKELISVEKTVQSLENISNLLPTKKIIVTISPIRHYRDGFFENNVSKSHLFAAVYQMKDFFEYFPSYEIIIDELRDYRFFTEDMIHPNQTAVDYVWDLFSKNYLTVEAQHIATEINQIQKALAHRPINSNSVEHQKFLAQTQQKIEKLGTIWNN